MPVHQLRRCTTHRCLVHVVVQGAPWARHTADHRERNEKRKNEEGCSDKGWNGIAEVCVFNHTNPALYSAGSKSSGMFILRRGRRSCSSRCRGSSVIKADPSSYGCEGHKVSPDEVEELFGAIVALREFSPFDSETMVEHTAVAVEMLAMIEQHSLSLLRYGVGRGSVIACSISVDALPGCRENAARCEGIVHMRS